ncbi:MAG: cell cycle transcriptional regulator TrcR [Alphaproteobacteria bacterium]
MAAPLMPKATASWLLDNTTLTFEQIADFCGLHILEIQALADGEAFVVGVDPIATEQLTLEEIEEGVKNPAHKLRLKQELTAKQRRTSGPRYTPLNKRQDKPDAVSWLLRQHGNLSDNQIIKLIGTTKSTIDKIRDRSHWNLKNLKPRNPVELGLCTERDLEEALAPLEKKDAKKETVSPKVRAKSSKPANKKSASPKKAAPKVKKTGSSKNEKKPKKETPKKAPSKKAAKAKK